VTAESMTSSDWGAEAQEALWESSQQFGIRLEVSEQVAVARELAKTDSAALTPHDVRSAFTTVGLSEPPTAFARDVLSRVKGVRPKPSLRDVILDFRLDAIRTLSRQFGGKPKSEDALRNHLLMYLPKRGYAEAHTGKGQTDILLPPPDDTIIETKVWTHLQEFEDGMKEIGEYIRTEGARQAFMVIFGDREPLPAIIVDYRQAIAEEREIGGLQVPVIVVPFDVEAPSKLGQIERRTARIGRG
jgi:hypothetical protein